MILVDTSVWIDFFRSRPSSKRLSTLLLENQVLIHPWVIGELMVGDLGPRRKEILSSLRTLAELPIYSINELSVFVHQEKLYGKGLSLIDLHLLFAVLNQNCLLWTHDKVLGTMAKRFGKSYF